MIRTALRVVAPLLALGLAACSLIQQPATPDPNALSTAVSGTLTAAAPIALPTEAGPTQPPATLPPEATDTEPPASETLAPTATVPPAASETPLPSATSTALTPTSGPTSTLPAGDILNTLGNPTWRDTLASGNNWSLGKDDFVNASVADSELKMTGLSTTDGWRLSWPVIQDFYLEMTVRLGDCSSNDRYGLMARVPDKSVADRGYLIGFTCDGRYSLRAWDGPSETMTQLVSLTTSSAIVAGSGKVNRVGFWAKGEQLALYANGTLLTQIDDDTFTKEGAFGVFVGARQTTNFTIYVDEIAYWANP